jgi:hypothetical protein
VCTAWRVDDQADLGCDHDHRENCANAYPDHEADQHSEVRRRFQRRYTASRACRARAPVPHRRWRESLAT